MKTGRFCKKTGKVLTIILILGGMCMGLFGCKKIKDLTTRVETGSCGENLTWTYDSRSKTLTISGTGDMEVAKFYWKEYNIKHLILEEGITSISEDAFAWQSGLSGELKLPSTLKKIGTFAFYSCQFTGDLIIPDGIERIEDYTFRDCAGFDGILHLPANCKYIGVEAFDNCSNFKGTLDIPDGVEELGRVAFGDCKGFTGDLIIPDSVKKIGNYCFSGCDGFHGRLQLSKNLEEIEENVFTMCENLSGDLIIPDGVKKIGRQAFCCCRGFNGIISIPDSVESIGYYAFSNCENLTGTLKLPGNLRALEDDTFSGCKNLTKLEMNEGLEYISKDSFNFCQKLAGEINIPSTVKVIGHNAFTWCENLTGDLILPEGLVDLDSSAFYGCRGLSGKLSLPSTLLSIGAEAFEDCAFTGEISIPDAVANVGRDAFRNCKGITAVYFGNGIDSVGEGAFRECENLKKAVFKDVVPDYHDAGDTDRKNSGTKYEEAFRPSFPEGCELVIPAGAVRKSATWKSSKSSIEAAAKDASGPSFGEEKEEPWYWTNSLNDTFCGAGRFADCEIKFEDNVIKLTVNGRDFSSSKFYADRDSEEQVIGVDTLCCKSGRLTNLELLSRTISSTNIIGGDIIYEDGTKEKVYFHNETVEDVYMSLDESFKAED